MGKRGKKAHGEMTLAKHKMRREAHKNDQVHASRPFSINMECIHMELPLTWMRRYRSCILGNKVTQKLLGA
jgi:hypothetical protein